MNIWKLGPAKMICAVVRPEDQPRHVVAIATLMTLISAPATPVAADTTDTGDNATMDMTLTVTDGANGTPLPDAVVEVVDSDRATPPDEPAIVAQEHHEFVPHLLVVPRGTSVDFPNHDETLHHVYSFSKAKTFDIELYADRPKAPIDFDRAGIVELGCNIHDRMQAFIYVARHAETGLTDANGQVDLAVPADAPVTLNVWHERLADNTRSMSRTINADDPATFTISLDVTAPEPESGAFTDLQKRFDNL